MAQQNTQIVFRRVHGRLVPIKIKRQGPNYADPAALGEGVKKGIAGGTAAYSAAKGVQYALFKRGSRLFDISSRFGTRAAPTMNVTSILKKNKTKLLQPDMFQQAAFKKASAAFVHNQQRAAKYALSADKLKKAAAFVGQHSLKFAIGAGLIAGAAAYVRHVALDYTKRKIPQAKPGKK